MIFHYSVRAASRRRPELASWNENSIRCSIGCCTGREERIMTDRSGEKLPICLVHFAAVVVCIELGASEDVRYRLAQTQV